MEKFECFYCGSLISYAKFWVKNRACCSLCAYKNVKGMTESELEDYIKIKKGEENICQIW